MKQYLLILCFVLGSGAVTQAQVDSRNRGDGAASSGQPERKTYAGRVLDASGQPLVGATVRLVGSNGATLAGTYTDAEGRYSLTVSTAQTGLSITVTSIGFASQTAAAESTQEFRLAEDSANLEEVVVLGVVGTQNRRSVTGSIASIKPEALENMPMTSIESMIQGQAAGVQVTQGSGKLGQGITVRVRGASSITAGNQPLYVVDGIPIVQENIDGGAEDEILSPIADINPNDIESFQILKDASAAARYGARASNGVVLITTKRGRAGKTRTNISYYYGVQSPTRVRPFLNSDQYVEVVSEAIGELFSIPGLTRDEIYGPGALLFDTDLPYSNTNWLDQVYSDNAPIQSVDVNVSGGNEKTTFYVSAGLFDQQGILRNNAFNRATGRLNLDHRVSDFVKVGANLSFVRSQNNRAPNDNQFNSGTQIVALAPMFPVRGADGEFNTGIPYNNPLIYLDNSRQRAITYNAIGNVYAEFSFLKNFTYRSDFGVNVLSNTYDTWVGQRAAPLFSAYANGYATTQDQRITNYNVKQTVTYANIFGTDHKIDATTGWEYLRQEFRGVSALSEGFPSDEFTNIGNAANPVAVGGALSGYAFSSFFLFANYEFKGKYLLTANIRADGASRFAEDERWGVFPGVSAGWILTEEDFLRDNTTFSFLKLRVGYGITGNAEINDFAWRPLGNTSTYRDIAAIIPGSLGNTKLKWERTSNLNVAVDYGFFDGRISGSLEFFLKQTRDLLLSVPIPIESGFAGLTQNIGELENRGAELSITSQNFRGDFNWTTTLNMTFVENEVTRLGPDGAPVIFNTRGIENRAQIGDPLGAFYGRRQVGVDPETGFAQYRRADGTITNSWNQAQIEFLGRAYPTFFGGLENRFEFKGIDLSFLFNYSFGNYVYYGTGIYSSTGFAAGFDNQTSDQVDRWQNPGDITAVPKAGTLSSNGEPSSRLLYKGDYIRLRNATLGYSFPTSVIESIGLTRLRVYVLGQNLLLIAPAPFDPEVGSLAGIANTGVIQGIEFYTVPQAKSYQVGVQISF